MSLTKAIHAEKKVVSLLTDHYTHIHTHTECVSVGINIIPRECEYFSSGVDGESARPADSCYRTNFSKRKTDAYQRPEKGEIRSLYSTLMELKYRVQICQREA